MTAAIVLRGVSKTFYRRTPDVAGFLGRGSSAVAHEVLRGLDLEVVPGTVVGLLGANGAGKTTLLEILCALLLPTSGDAFVHGVSVVRDPRSVRRSVGYCPSAFDSFYPRLSAAGNLEFFAALHGFSRSEARRRIERACGMAGVDGNRALEFQRHSSGMKQRLVLARALLNDPTVLLLDEPARSLDLDAQHALWQLVRVELVEKLRKTVLLVSHNLTELRGVCDRVAVLQSGRIVDVLSPEALADARVQAIAGSERQEVGHASR